MVGRFLWGTLSVGLVAVFASCGGKVAFEEGSGGNSGTGNAGTGNSGTGNSGTGNSGTGNSGTGGTGATGTGGTGNVGNASSLQEVCTDACNGILGSDCYFPDNCVDECMFLTDPQCEAEWIEVIQCIDKGASCEFPPACESALFTWDDCQNGGNCQQDCWTDNGFGCGCYYDCGPEMFETSCYSEPNQPSYCDCFSSGNYVGSCNGGPGLTCDVWESCCSQYWALQPG